jgi:hypothetical protein
MVGPQFEKYYTIILSVVVLVRYANNTKNQHPLLAQGTNASYLL